MIHRLGYVRLYGYTKSEVVEWINKKLLELGDAGESKLPPPPRAAPAPAPAPKLPPPRAAPAPAPAPQLPPPPQFQPPTPYVPIIQRLPPPPRTNKYIHSQEYYLNQQRMKRLKELGKYQQDIQRKIQQLERERERARAVAEHLETLENLPLQDITEKPTHEQRLKKFKKDIKKKGLYKSYEEWKADQKTQAQDQFMDDIIQYYNINAPDRYVFNFERVNEKTIKSKFFEWFRGVLQNEIGNLPARRYPVDLLRHGSQRLIDHSKTLAFGRCDPCLSEVHVGNVSLSNLHWRFTN
jgi:hypothetical protein